MGPTDFNERETTHDAHVEQFAFTRDAWGLGDFDDSACGPSFIDIVRFLGSIELAGARLRRQPRETKEIGKDAVSVAILLVTKETSAPVAR